jgi:hypothetical protein
MSEIKPELLITKTRRPQLPLNCVARPRLTSKLIEALRHKLVLLSAPAGYGKTTLVIEALQNCQIPVGWISLENSDNIPGNFWNYFIVALQSVIPGICQTTLNALQSPQPPPIYGSNHRCAESDVPFVRTVDGRHFPRYSFPGELHPGVCYWFYHFGGHAQKQYLQ